jgi:hypothetical protein
VSTAAEPTRAQLLDGQAVAKELKDGVRRELAVLGTAGGGPSPLWRTPS